MIGSLDLGDGNPTSLTWMDHRIWVPLVAAIVGGSIMFEGTSLANSLLGSNLDNSAAMMGAGSMAAAGGAALVMANMGRKGSALWPGVLERPAKPPGASDHGQHHRRRFQTAPNPNAGKPPNMYDSIMPKDKELQMTSQFPVSVFVCVGAAFARACASLRLFCP